jgi:hypothetical protein
MGGGGGEGLRVVNSFRKQWNKDDRRFILYICFSVGEEKGCQKLARGRILGRNWDKSREFFLLDIHSYLYARIYRSSFGCENDHFHGNKPKTLLLDRIRTQRRRCQLVLDEIRLGGSFQILELRRGRDQLVFMPKERPY